MDIPNGPVVGIAKVSGNFLIDIYRRFFPKKFSYPMAPTNLLEVVQPYTSKQKILELLGHPHSDGGDVVSYRFKNALLQLRYDDNGGILSVALGALGLRWPNRFKIFPLEFSLGKTTYKEVGADPTGMLVKEFSAKFYSVSHSAYFGFPGRYLYFTFSSMTAATYPYLGAGVFIHAPKSEESLEECPVEPYLDQRFNLVTISRVNEGMSFSWAEFM